MPFFEKRLPANDDPEAVALGLRSGIVKVKHTPETIERVSDARGTCVGEVDLYYETTAPEGGTGTKPHVVLIPGTGTTTLMYRRDDRADHLVGKLIDSGNFDVTLFDKRGHGLSSTPPGPYTVELIAADIAEALKQLFPSQKFHLYGTSLGLGTCMAIALDYPDICASLNGSGFLFDRTRRDFAAYTFSRPWVIRAIGMKRLSKMVQVVLKVRNKGLMPREFKNMEIGGYIHAASSWLKFNRKPDLPNLKVPTLIIVPQYDEDIGHRRKYYKQEMALMPEGICRLEYVPGFSHVMVGESTKKYGVGAEIIFNLLVDQLNSLK